MNLCQGTDEVPLVGAVISGKRTHKVILMHPLKPQLSFLAPAAIYKKGHVLSCLLPTWMTCLSVPEITCRSFSILRLASDKSYLQFSLSVQCLVPSRYSKDSGILWYSYLSLQWQDGQGAWSLGAESWELLSRHPQSAWPEDLGHCSFNSEFHLFVSSQDPFSLCEVDPDQLQPEKEALKIKENDVNNNKKYFWH